MLVVYNLIMKRQILIGVLAIASTLCLGLIMTPHKSVAHFQDLQISADEWSEITRTRNENNNLKIGTVTFGNTTLQADWGNNRLFYSTDSDSAAALMPQVTLSLGQYIDLATLDSKLSITQISENRPTKLLFYNNFEYRLMDLIITTLPIMNIDTMGHDIFPDNDSLAEIRLISPETEVISRTNIHIRGSTSRYFNKKSFKLSLINENGSSNKQKLLDMRTDDDWILNSLYADFEKVRNILSAQLWRDCCAEHNVDHVDNTFEYRYVELFVDDSYYGLFLLGYKPDKKVVDLGDDEVIFKNRDWVDADLLNETDSFENYYTIENDVKNPEQYQAELKDFVNLLATGSAADIRDNFDIINAIDIELHGMITGESDYIKDNKTKNLYITIKQRPDRRYILYTPWDFDLSFGNAWQGSLPNKTSTISYGTSPDYLPESSTMPVPMLREKGDKTIDQEVKTRYAELRRGAWSNENIMRLISEYEVDIFASGAYDRDCARWPDGNYFEGATNLSKFRDYVEKRLVFLDKYYGIK
jgi:CotH protein.